MLVRVTQPPTVHPHAHFRVGQRKPYDLNIGTARKLEERLTCLQNNPVKRGRVKESGDWPWSSWRYYYLNGLSVLRRDRLD